MVTPSGQGLPRESRLLRPADFARVYEARRSAAAGPLVVYALPGASAAGPARVGLSVSRRIGNAVLRNRWKRRLREAFRVVRPALPTGTDFVIVVRSGLPPAGAAGARRIEDLVVSLAGRATSKPARGAPDPGNRGRPERRR